MRSVALVFAALSLFSLARLHAEDGPNAVKPVPVLTVADSINPGSAAYILDGIDAAERSGASYLVLQLDTPGGLLSTTRKIVQKMLASPVPIVVYVGPRGAQAGSAGALITFAADVAAMAPGSNIGAAHPVTAGGGEVGDKTMREKVANDTSAFAESLARAHGRSPEWAAKSVKSSASLAADEALKNNVIDLVADDLGDLTAKLSGYKLRVPKAVSGGTSVTQLPLGAAATIRKPMTLRQRIVSFFADPTLAYLILSFAGLCLWVELSHPGLIFPGVVGAICFIISLVSFQMLPIDYGALALLLVGMALLVAELFVPAFGILGIGGIACFVIGSLFLMDTTVPEFRIPLTVIFTTAATLATVVLSLTLVVWRTRHTRVRGGMEGLIGEFGEVREEIGRDKPGRVFVHGELWSAVSRGGEAIPPGSLVVIEEAKDLTLVVALRRMATSV